MLIRNTVGKRSVKMQRRTDLVGWLFVTPATLLFILFLLLPICIAVVTGFSDFNGINSFGSWGFKNYIEIFTTDIFLFKKSLLNLLIYVAIYVPCNIILSLLLAILVAGRTRANKYFRLAFYIPSLTSGIAVAAVWSWMLNPEMGVINAVLRTIGLPAPNWLNDKNLAMVSVAIVSLWGGTAANMVLYVAAIQGINESLFEAARIEGAGAFRIAVKITIPMLRPITYFVMTTVLIGAFQLYDQALMLFPTGGPQNSALTPIMAINRATSQGMYYGRASAMSTVLFVIVFIVTNVLQRFRKEAY